MEELFKLKKREIIITNDFPIYLYEQTLFLADGGEGLHLWEASVVFSRYCLKNKELFENKKVIDLGTGCGLLGLSLLIKTNLNQISFSDYQDSVLNNLKTNIQLNLGTKYKHLETKYDIKKFDWREYESINDKYDIIVGSELIYKGGYIEELSKLIKRILNPNGICLISMPFQRGMTQTFLGYCTENNLKYSSFHINEIKDDSLFIPVLKDLTQSKKLFEDLKKMDFMVYRIEHK